MPGDEPVTSRQQQEPEIRETRVEWKDCWFARQSQSDVALLDKRCSMHLGRTQLGGRKRQERIPSHLNRPECHVRKR